MMLPDMDQKVAAIRVAHSHEDRSRRDSYPCIVLEATHRRKRHAAEENASYSVMRSMGKYESATFLRLKKKEKKRVEVGFEPPLSFPEREIRQKVDRGRV